MSFNESLQRHSMKSARNHHSLERGRSDNPFTKTTQRRCVFRTEKPFEILTFLQHMQPDVFRILRLLCVSVEFVSQRFSAEQCRGPAMFDPSSVVP